MKLQNMFQKSIDRSINGVIKVMQTDDENRRQELEEYVITRELQKHFGAFYDQYEKGVEGTTDKIGVWISGFFGSGKSHFLKILSYLLANEEVCGKKAIDYFADKFDYDPYRYEMMRRVAQTPTEVILFNIDAKSPMGKDRDAILRVFTKVFYEHCGYYGDDLKVAAFERFLDRQGKLAAFKTAFEQINTEPWETAREAFAFWEDDVTAALTQTTGISDQAARNWFNGTETAEISIDRLAKEIAEYVQSKAPNFHLVFLVDEIGQYIGDDSSLMLNLQTVVEELGSKCMGKVWVIVTSQEDIDSVTHVKGNDFSKIQGRFNTRLSLSSASVDEVIKRRILSKTETADTLLRLNYQQNSSVMRNLFSFAPGTIADLKGYSSEDEFVEAYPFVPYQFKLLQEVLVQVRKHGSSGKHLSGGERSMLSAFQEAAQQVKLQDENCFVPFYCFYDTVHTFLDGAVRRVIDRADRAAQEACLTAGGSAVVFPAGRLLDCPAPANVLYLADQGNDLPFSAQRALARNHFIHAMGEKTLVAQCRAGTGGTWDGTTENLRHGWNPVFVNSDGSEGAQALIARGAAPVRTLSSLDDLQPVQLQF